jgi:hypothetical protein
VLERGRPKGTPGLIALPIAGNDQRAKEIVMRLADELGFDRSTPKGSMSLGGNNPGTPVYDIDRDASGVRRASREASPERKPEWHPTTKTAAKFAHSGLTQRMKRIQ